MKKQKEENEAIEEAMVALQKKYGKDVVIQMDAEMDFTVERISTGCFSLDEALGGGLPRGRIIEVFGKEVDEEVRMFDGTIKKIQDIKLAHVFKISKG